MGKKILLAFVLSLLLSIVSCNDSEYYAPKLTTFNTFLIEQNISLDTIPIYNEFGYRIQAFDSLILLETGRDDGFVDIYSLNSYEKLMPICMIGKGNNEYITPIFTSQFSIDKNNHITLNSYNLQKFRYKIDLTESINRKEIVITEKEDLEERFVESFSINKLPNGGYFSKTRAYKYDARDKEYFPLQYIYENNKGEQKIYTPFPKPVNSNFNVEFYISSCRISPDGKKAVNAYKLTDHMDIIDIESLTIKGIKHKESYRFKDFDKIFGEKAIRTLCYYNDAVCATNDLFVTLYSYRNVCDTELDGKEYTSSFRIFDWNGKPLIKLNTDKMIFGISYNEKQRTIYCIDSDNKIYKYNMDGILKKVNL